MKDFTEFRDLVLSKRYQDMFNTILAGYQIPLDLPDLSVEELESLSNFVASLSTATALQLLQSYHVWANNEAPQ